MTATTVTYLPFLEEADIFCQATDKCGYPVNLITEANPDHSSFATIRLLRLYGFQGCLLLYLFSSFFFLSLLGLFRAESIAPFLYLLRLDGSKQVFCFANLVAGLDGICAPAIQIRKRVRAELLVDGVCRVGHIWNNKGGKEMHEIDSETDDCRTLGGFRLEQAAIQLVRLVTLLRKGEDGEQAGAQLDSIKLLNISRQKLADIIFKGVERVLMVLGPVWHDAVLIVRRGNELDNAADEVTQVLEQ